MIKALLLSLLALGPFIGGTLTHTEEPPIRLYYLGHSAFIIFFDNGVSMLLDYGISYSYGLPSPIYPVNGFEPAIVAYSHQDQDHDRGETFATKYQLRGNHLNYRGIDIKPFHTSEGYKNSNISYLISYKGFTILHLGDAQGDIVNIANAEEQKLLKAMFPNRLDLLLIPIGWTKDILKEAEATVGFLKPRQVIPMHYWYKHTKEQFLKDLESGNPSDAKYRILTVNGPEYSIVQLNSSLDETIQVVSLEPKPYNAN